MARKPEFRLSAPRTNLIGHGFLRHLKMPFQSSLKPILRAYRVGMELGETEFAASAFRIHTCLAVMIGMPLHSLEQQVVGHCDWFQEYGHTSTLVIVVPWLQLAQNLMGKSRNPLKLTGAAMDEDALLLEFEKTGDDHGIVNLKYARLALCYLLGDFQTADMERVALPKANDMDSTHLMKIFSTFFSGLNCLALARKTRSWHYQRQARRFVNDIRKYVKGGSVNGVPMLTLLTAEQCALGRKGAKDAKAAYDRAIVMAGRCGFRLMKGIACERAGVHLLSCNNEEGAATYLRSAYAEYLEYGATEKLACLEREYGFVDFGRVNTRQDSVLALKTFVPETRNRDS